jgi:hypothetical protein
MVCPHRYQYDAAHTSEVSTFPAHPAFGSRFGVPASARRNITPPPSSSPLRLTNKLSGNPVTQNGILPYRRLAVGTRVTAPAARIVRHAPPVRSSGFSRPQRHPPQSSSLPPIPQPSTARSASAASRPRSGAAPAPSTLNSQPSTNSAAHHPTVAKNLGALLTLVACSNPYASFSSVGSLYALPKNDSPYGIP